MGWLPVPIVEQVTGAVATPINMTGIILFVFFLINFARVEFECMFSFVSPLFIS